MALTATACRHIMIKPGSNVAALLLRLGLSWDPELTLWERGGAEGSLVQAEGCCGEEETEEGAGPRGVGPGPRSPS